jgi:hypothetical protein
MIGKFHRNAVRNILDNNCEPENLDFEGLGDTLGSHDDGSYEPLGGGQERQKDLEWTSRSPLKLGAKLMGI